jgi:hypothetical protein
MIFEPVPTLPRSRRQRVTRMLGLVMPAALLGLVVAGGLLGSTAGTRSAAPSVGQGSTGPAAIPPAGTTPVPAAASVAGIETRGIGPASEAPTVVADLAVRTVSQALAIRGQLGPGDVVAVAGGLDVTPAACPGAGRAGLGPLCERRGTLVAPSWIAGGGTLAPSGPHLDVRVPAGVGVPPAIADPTAGAGAGQVPVVVVGRFETGGETCPTRLECNVGFVVDRIMWIDGSEYPSQLVVDTGIDTTPADWILMHEVDAEVAAIGWSGTLLVTALLRPETVARVDPTAARALDAVPPPAGLVWYVRGIETAYDPTRYPLGQSPPRLAWALLDDVTGEVIARGRAG